MTPPPSTSGIVTPGSQLLPAAKGEILELMRAVVDRCAQQISVQLLEVCVCVCVCVCLCVCYLQ